MAQCILTLLSTPEVVGSTPASSRDCISSSTRNYETVSVYVVYVY